MKINGITADNFQRLNLLDVDMSGAILHLFAGLNESGKSSLREALRFALTGETVRVSKKGDYKLMIRDGAKSGSVIVDADGDHISRDIKTGNLTSDKASTPEYLPYLLDAQRFASQNAAGRRTFLLGLTGTSVEPDDIARRMKAKGVHDSCIESVKPMLRSGLDAAHKEASNRASEARAQWVGLTGRPRYGSQLAAEWKPDVPEGFDAAAHLDLEQAMSAARASEGHLNEARGAAAARLENTRAAYDKQQQTVAADPEEIASLKLGIQSMDPEAAAARDKVRRINAEIANAKEKAPVTCCECGSLLRVSFRTEPGLGTKSIVEPYRPLTDKEMEKLTAELMNASNDAADVEKELSAMRQSLAGMESVRLSNDRIITPEEIDKLSADVKELDQTLADLLTEIASKEAELATMRAQSAIVGNAAKIADRAQSLHRAVQAWETAVSALAPDGIPAEILSDTLRPVNNRLRNTANVTGWPQVSIDPTMEIEADGRRYSLLSESAQWRADAAIADAISHLSGLRLLILDRIDVLDLGNRAALLKWLQSVMGEYDTIMLFGTLKQLPKLPAGMAAHWIEDGEIVEDVKQ